MEIVLGPVFIAGMFAGFLMAAAVYMALLNRYQGGDYS
jgi:hypothetical protein